MLRSYVTSGGSNNDFPNKVIEMRKLMHCPNVLLWEQCLDRRPMSPDFALIFCDPVWRGAAIPNTLL